MNIHSIASRNGSPTRRRFSPSQIAQLLDQFERSDLSAAAFVRQHGLCYSAFCRWRKQPRGRAASPRFQTLPLGSLLGAAWAAEIAWPDGRTVRLQERAAPAWIAELLEALRRSC